MKKQIYEGVCSGFRSHFHEQTALLDKQTAALLLSQNKHKLVHFLSCTLQHWCRTLPQSSWLQGGKRAKQPTDAASGFRPLGLIWGCLEAAAGAADSADLPWPHTASPLQPQSSLVALLSFIFFITTRVCMRVSYWKYYSCILSQRLRWNKYS